MQRSGLLVDNNELDLLADLHTQADLGEWCAPVGWQFSLLTVKPGLPSWKVIGILVTPKPRAVMEGFLKYKQEHVSFTLYTYLSCARASFYLCAINLHGQRPPSISASKVAHVTVNRNLLRTKLQRVHLAFCGTMKLKIMNVRFTSSRILLFSPLLFFIVRVKLLKKNIKSLVLK